MTPAALEVLLDAAREGGATEEEVARVRWTAGPDPRVWLVQRHYDYEGEDVRAVCMSRAEAIAEAQRQASECFDETWSVFADAPDDWRASASSGIEWWVSPERLSRPENATGASAPRLAPETP